MAATADIAGLAASCHEAVSKFFPSVNQLTFPLPISDLSSSAGDVRLLQRGRCPSTNVRSMSDQSRTICTDG